MTIDKDLIKTRLQELAGNLKVKVTTHKHLKGSLYPSRAVSYRATSKTQEVLC